MIREKYMKMDTPAYVSTLNSNLSSVINKSTKILV
jgi:hypothetical protein